MRKLESVERKIIREEIETLKGMCCDSEHKNKIIAAIDSIDINEQINKKWGTKCAI
jgi:hypothetical protein